MEPNGISGGMFSIGGGGGGGGGSGMLGLEMSLNNHHQPPEQHQLPQQQTTSNFFQRHHHHQQPPPFIGEPGRQQPGKQAYPFSQRPRNSPLSDDDEALTSNNNNPSTTDDSGGGGGDGKMTKGSPWQRMKWTDNMVRLLIMVVYYIGDEAGSDPGSSSEPPGKKKGSAGAAAAGGGGVLQKKGKWKSVSRAMMERGFYVSPQQCEDKFNDLNKRYKRVNDILGKGTACKVVENQSLLETMDHISPKMKEEAKKLLNSKHLFFREMCAYHNSCGSAGGGGGGAAGVTHHSSPPVEQQPLQSHPQKFLHSHDKNTNLSRSNEDEDEEEDEDEDDSTGNAYAHYHQEDEEEEKDGFSNRKRGRMNEIDGGGGNLVQQFSEEVMGVVQDMRKSVWEKRSWMKAKMMQLEEERVGYQGEAYELEKQRMKWVKFSYKKEREMEVERLRNERRKLENDRMVVLLRQKELELIELQQQQQQYSSSNNKRASDPSSITG